MIKTIKDTKNWFGFEVEIKPKSVIIKGKVYETSIFQYYEDKSGNKGVYILTQLLVQTFSDEMKRLGLVSGFTSDSLWGFGKSMSSIYVNYKDEKQLIFILESIKKWLQVWQDADHIKICLTKSDKINGKLSDLGFK